MKMEYQNIKSNNHIFVKAHYSIVYIVNLNDEEINKISLIVLDYAQIFLESS